MLFPPLRPPKSHQILHSERSFSFDDMPNKLTQSNHLFYSLVLCFVALMIQLDDEVQTKNVKRNLQIIAFNITIKVRIERHDLMKKL